MEKSRKMTFLAKSMHVFTYVLVVQKKNYKNKLEPMLVKINCLWILYDKNSILWRLAKFLAKNRFFLKNRFFSIFDQKSKKIKKNRLLAKNIARHCFREKPIITFSPLLELITFRKKKFSDSTSGRSLFFRKMHHFSRFEASLARIRPNLCLWWAVFFSTSIMNIVFMKSL